MTKDEIIQKAMDCNSMMVLEMREMDKKDEFLLEFAASIIAATKEEDARICDDIQDCGPENGCCPTFWNEALERAGKTIRASKQGQS